MQQFSTLSGASLLVSTEADFDKRWLDKAFLSSCPKMETVSGLPQVSAYALDNRYVYELTSGSRTIWRGLELDSTRLAFDILCELYGAGLPVARPLALAVKRRLALLAEGQVLCYQLAEAESLVTRLGQAAVAEPLWQQWGALLRQLHDMGIELQGLQAWELALVPPGRVFLNKVTGLRRRPSGHPAWKQQDLQSLLASLVAARDAGKAPHFKDSDWLALTQAYIHRARPMAD